MTAEMGAKVLATDVNEGNVKEVVDEIRAKGQSAEYYVADVADKEQMDAAAAFAVEKFGRIDVLLNNAGIMPLAFFSDHKEAWRAWDKSIDVNIKGVVKDRKSTRLNSSHVAISYAVFCLKKKMIQ